MYNAVTADKRQSRAYVQRGSRVKPRATGHSPTCALLSYKICAKKSAMLTAFVEWDDGKPDHQLVSQSHLNQLTVFIVMRAHGCRDISSNASLALSGHSHSLIMGGLYGRGVHTRSFANDEMYTPRLTMYNKLIVSWRTGDGLGQLTRDRVLGCGRRRTWGGGRQRRYVLSVSC